MDADELWAVFQAVHAGKHAMAMDDETTDLIFAMQDEALELLEDMVTASTTATGPRP